jgi:hypothetical protein
MSEPERPEGMSGEPALSAALTDEERSRLAIDPSSDVEREFYGRPVEPEYADGGDDVPRPPRARWVTGALVGVAVLAGGGLVSALASHPATPLAAVASSGAPALLPVAAMAPAAPPAAAPSSSGAQARSQAAAVRPALRLGQVARGHGRTAAARPSTKHAPVSRDGTVDPFRNL